MLNEIEEKIKKELLQQIKIHELWQGASSENEIKKYEFNKNILKLLNEKDKIINLMAEKLCEYDFEEMCAEAEHYHISCPKEDDLDGYLQCVKQYFKKKAKENK